jgi:hypothetical protein
VGSYIGRSGQKDKQSSRSYGTECAHNEELNNSIGACSAFSVDSVLDNVEEDGLGTTHAIPAAVTKSGTATTSSSYNNEQSVS